MTNIWLWLILLKAEEYACKPVQYWRENVSGTYLFHVLKWSRAIFVNLNSPYKTWKKCPKVVILGKKKFLKSYVVAFLQE